jgi:hypothetical protein
MKAILKVVYLMVREHTHGRMELFTQGDTPKVYGMEKE